MSDVTLHDSWRSTAKKRLKKAELLKKMIVDFQEDSWNGIDLLRIMKSTGFAKMLSGSDRRRFEWTDSNIKSINNLNCSQDGQPGNSFLGFLGWNVFR